MITLALRLLAPWFAVLIFWTLLGSGWLALLTYHAQILFWIFKSDPKLKHLRPGRITPLALTAALAGPALYLILPAIAQVDLTIWLAGHGISRLSLLLLLPWFGIIHPILEQLHWSPLRERTPVAHFIFSGYHAIVLFTLLPSLWLALTFCVLAAASLLWRQLELRTGSLFAPILSHVLADFGVIMAALLLT